MIRSTSKVLRIGALLIALALVLASCGKSGHGHAVFSGSPSTTVGGTVTYSRYESLKFGYTILIPSTLAPGAENGNSQTAIWRSADGQSVLQVLSERRGATQPSSATQLSRCGIDLRSTGGKVTSLVAGSKNYTCVGVTGDGRYYTEHGSIGATREVVLVATCRRGPEEASCRSALARSVRSLTTT